MLVAIVSVALIVFGCVAITWVFFGIWHYRHYPEQKAIVERCERQHRQLMAGDDRGIYGDYPPRILDLDRRWAELVRERST